MNAALLSALITQVGFPELMRWLNELHSENRVVTEQEILAKLRLDADVGITRGEQFLKTYGGT